MAFGAATVAARNAGARVLVDPRPFAVGSIAETFSRYPHVGPALPAMGYSEEQLADLAATIERTPCDVVVTGTPIDLGHLISTSHPVRHARYELHEIGHPTIRDVIAPIERLAHEKRAASSGERKERMSLNETPAIPKHFLRVSDLDRAGLTATLDLAAHMKQRPHGFIEALRGDTLVCFFEKPSTRTRISFAAAAERLGMLPIVLGTADLQLGRGDASPGS